LFIVYFAFEGIFIAEFSTLSKMTNCYYYCKLISAPQKEYSRMKRAKIRKCSGLLLLDGAPSHCVGLIKAAMGKKRKFTRFYHLTLFPSPKMNRGLSG